MENKKIYSAIKEELGFCASIKTANPAHFATLCAFLERHPEAIEGYVIGDLAFVRNPMFGGIDLHLDGVCVSMQECFIKNNSVGKKHEHEFKVACRTTIEDQVNSFRSDDPCAFCGSSVNLEVDHVVHFQTLYENHFGTTRPPYTKDAAHRSIFEGDVARGWREYHAANATYRMLCKRCNGKRAKANKK
jgi:hypothetical protein